MKSAYELATEGLNELQQNNPILVPKVYLLVIDGKSMEVYASKETADYEKRLCQQADDELDESHVYRIREMDLNLHTL
jgi:hypothetical protein